MNIDLHCGACDEHYDSLLELSNHISNCPAAIVCYKFLKATFQRELIGHGYSDCLSLLGKYKGLINQYILSIVNEYDNYSRSKIHLELCEKLHLDFNTFKPFESKDITTLPTYEEAKKLLWFAIESAMIESLRNRYKSYFVDKDGKSLDICNYIY